MPVKRLSEISPGGFLASWKHSLIVLPPNTSRTFQMISSVGDLVTFSYIRRTQLVGDTIEPVIGIKWFNGMMEGRWFQTDEVMDGHKLFVLMGGVLLNTC